MFTRKSASAFACAHARPPDHLPGRYRFLLLREIHRDYGREADEEFRFFAAWLAALFNVARFRSTSLRFGCHASQVVARPQCVKGVSLFFWRAASRIARISSRGASDPSDRSSIRSETSATR